MEIAQNTQIGVDGERHPIGSGPTLEDLTPEELVEAGQLNWADLLDEDEVQMKSTVAGAQAHLTSTMSSIGNASAIVIPLSVDNDPLGMITGNNIAPEPGLYDFHCRTVWASSSNNKLVWLMKNGGIYLVNQGIGSIASATFNDVEVQEGDDFEWWVSLAAGTGGSVTAANVSVRRSGDPFG